MDFLTVTDPVETVREWVRDAQRAGAPHPDAMTLCTVDEKGNPRGRIVLLKGGEGRSLHFYTNYLSDKGEELERQRRASLVFFFPSLGRQARVSGATSKLSSEESDAYFATRPRLSQLGAWASRQSAVLGARSELDDRVEAFTKKYAGGPVPRPPHWGGVALFAEEVELWVASEGRLHDRARFHFEGEWEGGGEGQWSPPQLLNP